MLLSGTAPHTVARLIQNSDQHNKYQISHLADRPCTDNSLVDRSAISQISHL